jgi:hypothetical protein
MKGASSQKFVPIKTIHDGVLALDDGSFAQILLTNSLNLALKSADEQSAIISQFQNFFNSLDFPVQIFVKSRRANIDAYIATLEERVKMIDGELLRLQTVEYIDYIKTFTSEVNIMEKQFFVIVNYKPAITGSKSLNTGIFGSGGPSSSVTEQENLEKIRGQLDERVSVIVSGLSRSGLKLKTLNTEEAVGLFYSQFNPSGESKAIV